jgi:hypothetical protein
MICSEGKGFGGKKEFIFLNQKSLQKICNVLKNHAMAVALPTDLSIGHMILPK